MEAAITPVTSFSKPQAKPAHTYFAHLQGKELGAALFAKKREYEKFVENSGLQRLWRVMHWRFYGADPETQWTDHEVGRDGQEGEVHLLMMNHIRADVVTWLNLASGQRTTITPKCATDDYEAEIEVKRAKAALGHFNREAEIETKEDDAIEYAGCYGMSFLMRWWNRRRGEVLAPPPESAIPDVLEEEFRAGELEVHAVTPMDCFSDPTARGPRSPWRIIRLWQNRYDKAAEYPQFANEIINVTSEDDKNTLPVDLFNSARVGEGKQHRDEIPVYYFFHDDTPAVPGGRVVVLISPDVILEDFQLTSMYRRAPVRRLACAEIHRTPFGFTPAWGLLAPQEAQAALSTIGLTNAKTFGFGTIIAPKGADVDEQNLGDGLTLVEYTPGLEKPQALQMPQTPAEVYMFRKELISEMGLLVGVNSVVRGDPEASLKSGSALALVQAQAVQFSNDFQKNIKIWKEDHHLDTVTIAQMNMEEELQAEIAGNYEAALLRPFSGKDFSRVIKVELEDVNPLARTLAGKVQIADTLAERYPQQVGPGDYMRVLEEGSLAFMTRGETQKRAMLDRENELLAAGFGPLLETPAIDPVTGQPAVDPMSGAPVMQPGVPEPGKRYVRALITDDHRAHIIKHLEVLDNPAVRESFAPEAQMVIDAVLSHVEEHEKLAIEATLTRLPLLELTNQPPLQSALPPPPVDPGAAPGEKPKGGGEQKPGAQGGAPASALQPTPPGANNMPRQPQMPVNPSTGQRVENTPGP